MNILPLQGRNVRLILEGYLEMSCYSHHTILINGTNELGKLQPNSAIIIKKASVTSRAIGKYSRSIFRIRIRKRIQLRILGLNNHRCRNNNGKMLA